MKDSLSANEALEALEEEVRDYDRISPIDHQARLEIHDQVALRYKSLFDSKLFTEAIEEINKVYCDVSTKEGEEYAGGMWAAAAFCVKEIEESIVDPKERRSRRKFTYFVEEHGGDRIPIEASTRQGAKSGATQLQVDPEAPLKVYDKDGRLLLEKPSRGAKWITRD